MNGERSKIFKQENRKKFDLHGDRESIENTSEYPVMYKALNSEPKSCHPYNVYNDIVSEPSVIARTLEVTEEITTVIASEMEAKGITQIINVGLPTSRFVGMVLTNSIIEHAGIQSWHIDSTDFLLSKLVFDWDHTAFFLFSGSGATHDTNEAARVIKQKGGYSVAFTSIAGSPITEKCNRSIVTAGGMDTGGSDTFHYATRLAAGLHLTFKLGKTLQPESHDFDALIRELKDAPVLMEEKFDSWDKRSWSIAKWFWKKRSVLVVGGGPNYGSAEEMALKFDEMAHNPAKAMNPTRHLHGVFGLTDENILTIIIAPPSPYEKWLHQIAEVTTILKAPAVAIVNEEETYISDQVDYVIRLPTRSEYIFAVLAVPVLQLIPYYFAVADGSINPDCQRSNIPKHARAWNHVFPPGSH
ncbi:MAG: SIS domain-containing protein [Promethearchaeota archaeon]